MKRWIPNRDGNDGCDSIFPYPPVACALRSKASIFESEHSVLIHKYNDNGIFRFEPIPTNNERCVPSVVRKRRERKKLIKDDIPFGLVLFLYLLRCSSLTYRSGYAAFTAPLILNKRASAIVNVFMNQSTRNKIENSGVKLYNTN
ncbi:hypothetical protein KAU32_10485 [bacterium]|nr:hypothetical protein [bacterium]